MKQEYHFTISRTDRICLIAFVLFLLGWELIKHIIPPVTTGFIQSVDLIPTINSTTKDSILVSYMEGSFKAGGQIEEEESSLTNTDSMAAIEPVKIMEASWADLRKIGLSGKAASNIEKYIAAGGVLKNEKDVLKIYGMDTMQWNAASPYIIFPDQKKDQEKSSAPEGDASEQVPVIDLNTASATDLEALPGIGMVLADRIIKYRTNLGGFITVRQLKECYGLPPETFEKIMPRLTIIQPATTISINETDFTNFTHPYLNRKMISLLQAYKKQHGPFSNASDLRKIYPPDTAWCERILPYIKFE